MTGRIPLPLASPTGSVHRRGDGALAICGLFCIAQLGFVVLSGGGWMENARFLAPALPLALILVFDIGLAGRLHPREAARRARA